jgi:hypothetical protein
MKQRLQRGQAAVEFAIFTIILVILLLIPIQLAWIGVQKWQFTHMGWIAARSWSVHTHNSNWGANEAMLNVSGAAVVRGWAMFSGLYVGAIPPMWASTSSKTITKAAGGSISTQGFKFNGYGKVLPIFKPFFGFTGPWGYTGWDAYNAVGTRISISTLGWVEFEGYVPMEKEPSEQPNTKRRDNDCKGTPCEKVNGR